MFKDLISKTIIYIQDTYTSKLIFQIIQGLLIFVRDEIKTGPSVPISFIKRIRMYKNGFLSRSYYLYDFKENDSKLYLSDLKQKAFTTINKNPDITRNKKLFHKTMNKCGFETFKPKIYGEIKDGCWKFYGYDTIYDLLNDKNQIVIKPSKGAKGRDVHLCYWDGKCFLVNGTKTTVTQFKEKIKKESRINYDCFLIEEFIHQAKFLSAIYPHSSNTIRIIAVNDKDNKIFFPIAVLRIGCKKSGYLDNFSQGGLSANIDLNNGTIGKAGKVVNSHEVKWYRHHPDTGSLIQGVEIPNWNEILNELSDIICRLPGIEYVGIDLLISESGELKIIEMNSCPDIDLLQIHKPLLKNRKLKEFFLKRGVPL